MVLLWFLLLRGSCHHPPRLPAWWCGPGLGQEVLKLIQLIGLAPPGASATIWLTQALQPPQGCLDQSNESEYTAHRVTPLDTQHDYTDVVSANS